MVPQVPRRDAPVSFLRGIGDRDGSPLRSAGRAAASITAQLNGLEARQEQKQRVADAEATAKRTRAAGDAGRAAGLNADQAPIALRADDTDEGRAYNASMTRGYLARMEITARSNMDRIAADNAHDPAIMSEKLEAYKVSFQSGVPEPIAAEFRMMMDGVTSPYLANAGRLHRDAVAANDKAIFADQLADRQTALARHAYLDDGTPETDAQLASDFGALQALLVAHGPKTAFEIDGQTYAADPARSGTLDPLGIVKTLDDAGADMAVKRITGRFSRLTGESSQRQMMADLEADYKAGTGLIGDLPPAVFDRIRGTMVKTIGRHQIARNKMSSAAMGQLRDLRGVVSQGFRPDAAMVQDLSHAVRMSGDGDLRAAYEGLTRTIDFMDQVEQSNPAQLRDYIGGFEQPGATVTPAQGDNLALARRTLSTMETALARDPLDWAARQGVANIVPLDLEADLPEQLIARRAEAAAVSMHYGTPPKLLTRPERDALSRLADQGGDQMINVAGALSGLDDETGFAVMAEISEEAPLLANISALMREGGSPGLIGAVADGMTIMAQDGFKSRLPDRPDLEALVSDELGDAFSELPGAYDAVRLTAQTAFEAQAFRAGLQPGDMVTGGHKKQLSRNFQEAIGASYDGKTRYGGTTTVSDRSVIAPSWLEARRLDDVVERLTASDWVLGGQGFGPVDADGRVMDPADLIGAQLISVGRSRYRVALTDPYGDDPQYAGDVDGGAFVLDLDGLQDRIRRDPAMGQWVMGAGATIDLQRPILENSDGSFSTEETITVERNGKWFNVPTIVNGVRVPASEIETRFLAGDANIPNVGQYSTLDAAVSAASKRSNEIGIVRGAGR